MRCNRCISNIIQKTNGKTTNIGKLKNSTLSKTVEDDVLLGNSDIFSECKSAPKFAIVFNY